MKVKRGVWLKTKGNRDLEIKKNNNSCKVFRTDCINLHKLLYIMSNGMYQVVSKSRYGNCSISQVDPDHLEEVRLYEEL